MAMVDARSFAEGHDLEDFLEDRLLGYGIERALEIVGEAASNLSEKIKDRDRAFLEAKCGSSATSSLTLPQS